MCQTACIRNDKPLMKFHNAILVQNLAVVDFFTKSNLSRLLVARFFTVVCGETFNPK